MSTDIADRIATQNAEFDAVKELAKQYRRIELTPVVDDDYPAVRFDYERAVRNFLDAVHANGRTAASASAPSKPRASGYNAAYRMKLEKEFEVDGRMHRLPRWMKESVSRMLKEIENLRAKLDSADRNV